MNLNRYQIALTSPGVFKRRLGLNFFNLEIKRFARGGLSSSNAQDFCVLGWGLKPSSLKMKRLAAQYELTFYCLEDGLIAYLSHPTQQSDLLSLIVDDLGIYYDPRTPSRLELNILEDSVNLTFQQLKRARNIIQRIRKERVTKYNLVGIAQDSVSLAPTQAKVLVVDQTVGDISITLSNADSSTFIRMLKSAIEENPKAKVFVKTHPDVLLGKKTGYLSKYDLDNLGVGMIAEKVSAPDLLVHFDKVYTVCSQIGFEALIQGKSVVTFGLPFYAGWGLTDDRGAALERRGQNRTIEQLVHSALIDYPIYVNPDSKRKCEVEEIIEHIALQKSTNFQISTLRCCNFSLWKRAFLPHFLNKVAINITFFDSIDKVNNLENNERVLLWGIKDLPNGVEASQTIRAEDGFIRSIGLGAELRRPNSLVFDTKGIYFDPRTESDLEHFLNNTAFSEQQENRAANLLEKLLEAKVSKYNVGAFNEELFSSSNGRKKILVVGQVEDDASIQTGCISTRTNLDLLREVRKNSPKAYIVYKPHPDVLTGNRIGNIELETVLNYADEQQTDVNIIDCIEACDELHTMTSLAGFEALIRDKIVHCYGQPFYSSWGLTNDKHPVERRKKKLTINQLVYGTLIEYPVYINWDTGNYTTPEFIIEQMKGQQAAIKKYHPVVAWVMRNYRKARYLTEALLRKY